MFITNREYNIYIFAIHRIPMSVSFSPHEEKEVNFNVQIEVKKRTQPICLNVKAEGYSMNAMVMCEDSNGKKVELSPRGVNEINLGEVSACDLVIGSDMLVVRHRASCCPLRFLRFFIVHSGISHPRY